MQTATAIWNSKRGWSAPAGPAFSPDWILYFGSASCLENGAAGIRELAGRYPDAVCCGCSTAGEILGRHVRDDSIVAAQVRFDDTKVRAVAEPLQTAADSIETGRRIAKRLLADDLRHVLVLSEGLSVNGTSLLEGFREVLPAQIAVTGGLAADGSRFKQTIVGLGSQIQSNQVVGVGFYGSNLRVKFASEGGWGAFGPQRKVTRSDGNVLYELDGVPALKLYKSYLGEWASGLPATGLLFPLELSSGIGAGDGLVRTILSVDEADQSLTFAGNIPGGGYARLMKAGTQQLVSGAETAGARAALRDEKIKGSTLAVLVSCVGRRLVLKHRVEEEVEAVAQSMENGCDIVGFYSYGETCPKSGAGFSELHNQTMTVTVIGEIG